jgi:hypothetical protein
LTIRHGPLGSLVLPLGVERELRLVVPGALLGI